MIRAALTGVRVMALGGITVVVSLRIARILSELRLLGRIRTMTALRTAICLLVVRLRGTICALLRHGLRAIGLLHRRHLLMPLLRVLVSNLTGLHRLRSSLLRPCLLVGIALVLVTLLTLGLRNVTGLLILLLLPWLLRLRSLARARMLGMLPALVIGHMHLRIS